MTMARSVMHGHDFHIDFPEEEKQAMQNCYPLGLPSFVYLDEDDIPTKRFVRPNWEPTKPIPFGLIAYVLMALILLTILVAEVWFFLALFA